MLLCNRYFKQNTRCYIVRKLHGPPGAERFVKREMDEKLAKIDARVDNLELKIIPELHKSINELNNTSKYKIIGDVANNALFIVFVGVVGILLLGFPK
jgi:hypothetical protein